MHTTGSSRPSLNYLGVTDPADFAWMKSKITPHPWKCFTQKLRMTDEASRLTFDVDPDPRRVGEKGLHQRKVDPQRELSRGRKHSDWPDQPFARQVGEQRIAELSRGHSQCGRHAG